MKAWIISDLHATHADFRSNSFEIPEADICLCAGDISGFIEFGLDFLKKKIAPSIPVVAVLGNHDFYGSPIDRALEIARREAFGSDIEILENDTLEIGDVRIIGATLWTDFEIPWGGAESDDIPINERRELALSVCRQYMLDFHEIYRSEPFSDGIPGLITSRELIHRHHESRAFIATQLAKPWTGSTVVLTHHAPSPRSLIQKYLGHPSNAAFASDMTDIIRRGRPDFWIHGHMHEYLDYIEDRTRVICNPLGYRHERGINGFRPGLVIDL